MSYFIKMFLWAGVIYFTLIAPISAESDYFKYQFDADVTALLLKDEDPTKMHRMVNRWEDEILVQVLPFHLDEKQQRLNAFSEKAEKLEHFIHKIGSDLNQIFGENKRIFASKGKYNQIESRNMIIFLGVIPPGKLSEKLKLKKTQCELISASNNAGRIISSYLFVSINSDPRKYFKCVERQLIKSLGLFGSNIQVHDFKPGSFYRKVLTDLYLTDKYVGLSYEELNKKTKDIINAE